MVQFTLWQGDFSAEPQPLQVIVTGLPSDAQQDTIQFFFENRRRTGGGPTADIQFEPDKGSAIITYIEHEGRTFLPYF